MSFRQELSSLINRHSLENVSDTPDYILAEFLEQSLAAFDAAVHAREVWYGRPNGNGPAINGDDGLGLD